MSGPPTCFISLINCEVTEVVHLPIPVIKMIFEHGVFLRTNAISLASLGEFSVSNVFS